MQIKRGKSKTNDDLEMFNTIKVNQRRTGMLHPLPMNQRNIVAPEKEEEEQPFTYRDPLDDHPDYVPKRKGGKLGDEDSDDGERRPYLNIGRSSLMDDLKDDMERKMLAMVYKYTRPEIDMQTGKEKKMNKLDLSSIKERGI